MELDPDSERKELWSDTCDEIRERKEHDVEARARNKSDFKGKTCNDGQNCDTLLCNDGSIAKRHLSVNKTRLHGEESFKEVFTSQNHSNGEGFAQR